jgi:hypothetical protein
MKKTLVRFAMFAGLLVLLGACSVKLPPIDVAGWFGGGDTLSGEMTDGIWSATSPEAVSSADIPAFSRGGIRLSSISLGDGTVAPAGVALVAPQQAGEPAELLLSVYLSTTSMASATDGDLLVTVSVDLESAGDGSYTLVAGSVEYVSAIDDSVLTEALSAVNFFAGVVCELVDSSGTRVAGDWTFSIDSVTAEAALSLF